MLKNICRNYNTPIIGISSFNRDNYNSPVNMSAFKESGSLEYSADVLLALQPEGMSDGKADDGTYMNAEKTKTHNIQKVKECKESTERDIELVILKNRNGATNKTLNFKYYAMFNCFKETKKDYAGEYMSRITKK
jgi:replicative DNA helicase